MTFFLCTYDKSDIVWTQNLAYNGAKRCKNQACRAKNLCKVLKYAEAQEKKGSMSMKRVFSLAVVVLLLVMVCAPAALAADGGATVTVSISVNGELVLAAEKVTTSATTVDALLQEVHAAYCPEGADGYASGIDATYNMFMISKVWGVVNTPYVILNAAPLATGENAAYTAADSAPLKDGDNIVIIQDTTYMVPVVSLTAVEEGGNVTLTATKWALDFNTFTYNGSPYVGEVTDASGASLGTTDGSGVLTVPATAKAVIAGVCAIPADGSAVVAAAPAPSAGGVAAPAAASGDAITVYVSISANGVLEIAAQPVQITTYTVEAALIEAHRLYCPQGEAGFGAGIDPSYAMYLINTMWGVPVTPYVMLNSAPLGSGVNSAYTAANACPVTAGDNIMVVADASSMTPAVCLEYDAENNLVKVNQWALDMTTFQYTNGALEGIDLIDAQTGEVLGTTNALGQARVSKAPACGVVAYQGVSAVPVAENTGTFECIHDKYVAPVRDYSLFGGPDGKSLLRILIVGLGLVIPLLIVVLYAQNKEVKMRGVKYEDLTGDREITHRM